tara:strand:- start:9838 stop:10395 length:558 start_codon:yes stop_codon:yes gene_type:complete
MSEKGAEYYASYLVEFSDIPDKIKRIDDVRIRQIISCLKNKEITFDDLVENISVLLFDLKELKYENVFVQATSDARFWILENISRSLWGLLITPDIKTDHPYICYKIIEKYKYILTYFVDIYNCCEKAEIPELSIDNISNIINDFLYLDTYLGNICRDPIIQTTNNIKLMDVVINKFLSENDPSL